MFYTFYTRFIHFIHVVNFVIYSIDYYFRFYASSRLLWDSNVLTPHFNCEYLKNGGKEKNEKIMNSLCVYCKPLTEILIKYANPF